MSTKSYKSYIAAAGLCLLPVCSSLAAVDYPTGDLGIVRPFFGVDAQHRHMEFEKNFGHELFPEHFPQYNLFAGVRVGQYFGVAVGHENSRTRKANTSIDTGATLLGLAQIVDEGHRSSAKIKGTYAEVMGFLPLDFMKAKSTELFLGLGYIHNKLTLENLTVEALGGPVGGPDFEDHYAENDDHFRGELGIQKIICNHLGLRLSLSYENTSRFKHLKPVEFPEATTNVNLKNSWATGLGFFWVF
jgi:hypothetical protein